MLGLFIFYEGRGLQVSTRLEIRGFNAVLFEHLTDCKANAVDWKALSPHPSVAKIICS